MSEPKHCIPCTSGASKHQFIQKLRERIREKREESESSLESLKVKQAITIIQNYVSRVYNQIPAPLKFACAVALMAHFMIYFLSWWSAVTSTQPLYCIHSSNSNLIRQSYSILLAVLGKSKIRETQLCSFSTLMLTQPSFMQEKHLSLPNSQVVNHLPGLSAQGESSLAIIQEPNCGILKHFSLFNNTHKELLIKEFDENPGENVWKFSRVSNEDEWILVRDIPSLVYSLHDETGLNDWVAREYINDPILLHGHKVEIQMFGLVGSINPGMFVVLDDGIVTLSMKKYRPIPREIDYILHIKLTDDTTDDTNETSIFEEKFVHSAKHRVNVQHPNYEVDKLR